MPAISPNRARITIKMPILPIIPRKWWRRLTCDISWAKTPATSSALLAFSIKPECITTAPPGKAKAFRLSSFMMVKLNLKAVSSRAFIRGLVMASNWAIISDSFKTVLSAIAALRMLSEIAVSWEGGTKLAMCSTMAPRNANKLPMPITNKAMIMAIML